MKFSDTTFSRFPETHHILLHTLSDIFHELEARAKVEAFRPLTSNPVEAFNGYIDFALAIYHSKLFQLFRAIVKSIEDQDYLIYAQSGRAVLENTATIRYYARHQDFAVASGAWNKSSMTDPILRKANETLDRFIRGNRFSWDAFMEGRLNDLSKTPHQDHLSQINSNTCLQKWFKDQPNLETLYDLFCDLVHPNFGSNLLVLGTTEKGLLAGGEASESISIFIVAPTMAGLIGTYKEFEKVTIELSALKLLKRQ